MTQKSLQDAVGPTGMSDAVATMMGLKVYSHGTTYNGGNAPTTTSSNRGALTILHSRYIPYQMQDGSWRIKGDLTVSFGSYTPTAGTAGYVAISVNGWVNTANNSVGTSGSGSADVAGVSTLILGGSSSVNIALIILTTNSGASCVNASMAFDVALASKPTWAY